MRSSLPLLLLVLLPACGGSSGPRAEMPPAAGEPPGSAAAALAEPGPPVARPQEAAEVAREFWIRLAARDSDGAIALASYPFDLDAHDACVEDAEEMRLALADQPLPPDAELLVGQAVPVSADMDLSGLHEHWHERIPHWTGPEAPCLGEQPSDGTAVELLHFLVEFTLDGDEVGSLTRVRCLDGRCGVAGTDN